jgi:hypothetical protein
MRLLAVLAALAVGALAGPAMAEDLPDVVGLFQTLCWAQGTAQSTISAAENFRWTPVPEQVAVKLVAGIAGARNAQARWRVAQDQSSLSAVVVANGDSPMFNHISVCMVAAGVDPTKVSTFETMDSVASKLTSWIGESPNKTAFSGGDLYAFSDTPAGRKYVQYVRGAEPPAEWKDGSLRVIILLPESLRGTEMIALVRPDPTKAP